MRCVESAIMEVVVSAAGSAVVKTKEEPTLEWLALWLTPGLGPTRATRGGALGKCGSCIPGLTYGTGSYGHSRQRGTVAGYGKIDGTGAGRNGASYCGGCGNCHDR